MVVSFFASPEVYQQIMDAWTIYGLIIHATPVFDMYEIKIYGVTPDIFQKVYDWVNYFQKNYPHGYRK